MMESAGEKGSLITLVYSDTLLMHVNERFDLPVIINQDSKISAISLGFLFDPFYLQIDSMILADNTPGFFFSVHDSSFQMAWSSILPLELEGGDTLMVLNMKALDISDLTSTLKLRLDDFSELADTAANPIEGVVLRIPEIAYLSPKPPDSIGNNKVMIYPCPFREGSALYFSLESEADVLITVINVTTMEIFTLTEKSYPIGDHKVALNGADFSVGLYMVRFELKNPLITGRKTFKIIRL